MTGGAGGRSGPTRLGAARRAAARAEAARPGAAWPAATLGGAGRLGAIRAGVARAGTGRLGATRAGVARAGTGRLGATRAGTGPLAATQLAAARRGGIVQHVVGSRMRPIGTGLHRPGRRLLGRAGLVCLAGPPGVTKQPRVLANVPAHVQAQSSTGAELAGIAPGHQARKPGVPKPRVAMSEVHPRGTRARPSAASNHAQLGRRGSSGAHLEE